MTLKAFKSAIRPGMQISTTHHWQEKLRFTLRTVTEVQGNGFFYLNEGDTQRSWMEFPKAAELEFDGMMARIRIGAKHWTLELAPNGIVDHYRWERARGDENEIEGARRMSEAAQARGADMKNWWKQWSERSVAWRDEISHGREESIDVSDSPPAL